MKETYYTDRKRKYIKVAKAESTNNALKEIIKGADKPQFTVFCAREQTNGKGRLGRSFYSPDGGLYFSVCFPLAGKEKNITFLTLLAGLCTAQAIDAACGTDISLKWPNDLILNGRKLGGILTELVIADKMSAVVGIGINLTISDSELPEALFARATSIKTEGFPVPEREVLIFDIVKRMDEAVYSYYELFNAREDTLAELRRRSYTIGREIMYEDDGRVITAVAIGIEANGALKIRHTDGSEKIIFSGRIKSANY